MLQLLMQTQNLQGKVLATDLVQRELLSHDLKLSTLPNDGYLMLEKWQENCTREAKEVAKSSPAKKQRPTSTCRLAT